MQVETVNSNPLMVKIYNAGGHDSTDNLGEKILEVLKEYSGKKFNYVPISYRTPADSTQTKVLCSLLMIEI